jgi:Protein of unknown function (DUF3592)
MKTILLLLGMALLGFVAFILLRRDVVFLSRKSVRVTGKVTGHRKSHDDGSDFYSANIEFLDERGEAHRLEDDYGLRTPFPAIGQEVNVIYPEGAPQIARVPRPFVRIILYLFVFGVITVLVSELFKQ